MKILIIGHVWPEPKSSAAGSRMLQMINIFKENNWQIHFASTALQTEFSESLSDLEITTHNIKVNNPSFDTFISQLQPEVVLFDRFMVEEQFGWRVAQHCPQALRILDTEDLHGLRKGRLQALKEGVNLQAQHLHNDYAKREITSIYRCDLSLIISEYELELLVDFFEVPRRLLSYLPFLVEKVHNFSAFKRYNERKDFVIIGNFIHEPNWDAVQYLNQDIWPAIRSYLPHTNIHIYGAYVPSKAKQLHNPRSGFLVHGRVQDALAVIGSARVMLAPLRAGAGLKGKLLEAMLSGTPSITTSIGAEGMSGDLPWNGFIADTPADFALQAYKLYTDQSLWLAQQLNGREIINKRFQKKYWKTHFITHIHSSIQNLEASRISNFTGAMLTHHSLQATKYMSKWIEAKNKL